MNKIVDPSIFDLRSREMRCVVGLYVGASSGGYAMNSTWPHGYSWIYGAWTGDFKSELRSLLDGCDRVFFTALEDDDARDVRLNCMAHGVSCEAITQRTFRKFAAGRANAGIPAMLEAARAWGFRPENARVAYALAILLCGRSQ